MGGRELERYYFDRYPEALVRSLVRVTSLAYQESAAHCGAHYQKPEAAYMVGHDRRARVEEGMRGVAERYAPVGVIAEFVDPGDGSHGHTELRNGGSVLTASHVNEPRAFVAPARFRETLAREQNDQLAFPGLGRPPAPRSTAAVYGILLHSSIQCATAEERKAFGVMPGSVLLAFPHPNLKKYVHTIDLMSRYPDTVADSVPYDWDDEVKLSYLRRVVRVRHSA